jgi:hypothetical protein
MNDSLDNKLDNKAKADAAGIEILEKKADYEHSMMQMSYSQICGQYGAEDEDGNLSDNVNIIIPDYQREYRWDYPRKYKFIESLLLGIPLLPLVFAKRKNSMGLQYYEVVDGSQRIRTMTSFMNNDFRLRKLENLKECNGMKYSQLPKIITRNLNLQIIPIMLLHNCNNETTQEVFQRINTTSLKLQPTEVRRGSTLNGPFFRFIEKLTQNSIFNKLCNITDKLIDQGEREELILRFFAYSNKYQKFKHDVTNFLDDYLNEKNDEWGNTEISETESSKYEQEFISMLNFVGRYFPNNFKKSNSSDRKIARIRFEAISVGTNLALRMNPDLHPDKSKLQYYLEEYKDDAQSNLTPFERLTETHGSNNKGRLAARVEYIRDLLLSL